MKKNLLIVLALLLPVLTAAQSPAQTILPTVSANAIAAGKTVMVTVSYTAGTSAVAGVEWVTTLPAGAVISGWTAGAESTATSKAIYCGGIVNQAQTCLATGLNITPIASGGIASAVITLPVTARGAETITVASTIGGSPIGSAVTVVGGTVSVTALSPFDLNGNGLSTASLIQADLQTGINQVIGTAPCTGANFLNDGCTIADIELLVIDLISSNP